MTAPYTFTDEQAELRSVVRSLVGARRSARAVYDGTGSAPDPALWADLVAVGTAGLGIAEDEGGSGGGLLDQLVVAEELGRAVAPVGFVASAVATAAIVAAKPGAERTAWLAGIANGRRTAGIALHDPGHAYDCAGADLLVVLAADGHLAVVDRPTVVPLPSVDRTRPMTVCRWDPEAAIPLDTDTSPSDLRALQWALYAAEAVGVAADALAATAAYTTERRQFGLPIGTFQGVKHRLADMLVDVECARSAAYGAVWAIRDEADATLPAHLAQAVATEATTRVVSGAIQLHGGVGVTWEHDLHLHLRRAKALELAHGSPGWHYDRIADALLGPAGERACST